MNFDAYPGHWIQIYRGFSIKNEAVKNSPNSPPPLPCGVLKLTPQGKPSPIEGEGISCKGYSKGGEGDI